jgi:hypothetical protein
MPKNDQWRFMRAARIIHTDTPAQKLILMLLASHINGQDGSCYPSYDLLMRESGFTSKATITSALQYLRIKLKIVKWTKGWGNAHGRRSNRYQFDFDTMSRLADESSPDVDESSSDVLLPRDESSSDVDEIPPGQSLRTSIEVPAKLKEEPALKNPARALFKDQQKTEVRKGNPPSLEESSPSELSSPAHPTPTAPTISERFRNFIDRQPSNPTLNS